MDGDDDPKFHHGRAGPRVPLSFAGALAARPPSRLSRRTTKWLLVALAAVLLVTAYFRRAAPPLEDEPTAEDVQPADVLDDAFDHVPESPVHFHRTRIDSAFAFLEPRIAGVEHVRSGAAEQAARSPAAVGSSRAWPRPPPPATPASPAPTPPRKLGLVAVPVGESAKSRINTLVHQFGLDRFTFMLFIWDQSDWSKFPWFANVTAIRVARQAKFWYAKRFIPPEVALHYDYIWLLDDDMVLDFEWSPVNATETMRRYNVHFAQPALTVGTHFDQGVIEERVVENEVGHWANFVEMMAPIISRGAYACAWTLTPWDTSASWGVDNSFYPVCSSLGYCRFAILDGYPMKHLDTKTFVGDEEQKRQELKASQKQFKEWCEEVRRSASLDTKEGRASITACKLWGKRDMYKDYVAFREMVLSDMQTRGECLERVEGVELKAVPWWHDDIDRLVELCARKLAADNDPESVTVKAQVYFDSTFPQQAEFLHREHLARKNTMVGYVLLKSAMGNPTDVQVAREAAVALESVFPQGEVATYLALPRPDKERQLNGLAQLVSGIRLFNRHVNKASRDKIENIPELSSREIKDAFALIKEKTSDAELRIKAMAAILSAEPAVVAPDVSARMATALVSYRQLLIYLDSMAASLRDLAAACRARAAVPVDHVYPRFMELAALWRGFQDELFLDAFGRGILDTLALFESAGHMAGIGAAVTPSENTATDVLGLELVHLLAQAPASVRDAAQREPIEVAPMPDDAIVAAVATLQSEATKVRHRPHLGAPGCDMEVLHPGNTAQCAKLPVELGGFCPVSLVAPRTLGLVVPGNWNHGVIKYRDKLYAFRTPSEAKQFAAAP
ncbi:hypothetical protein AMAG_19268 [Allomyces macrogynus ATCC 38327]|uniref:Cilia- and flagella-associated protein 206 n=1 Tax=Allomyces macrogynus (strain ATCC 38327) TaxID=578462 RepID=A0A0L0SQE3_ALLM3|nr:hypothetical protein AMAG_19268 [Allomyces macrogynus ATCC 38327]|eukprot:KNE64727.1 hypothetical protein AMAG_19268 [Allomyces macrogynus ATCC 38327]